jgi:hypothetical protein
MAIIAPMATPRDTRATRAYVVRALPATLLETAHREELKQKSEAMMATKTRTMVESMFTLLPPLGVDAWV